MTPDLLLALLGFALVTSVTPGPNNMMLLASGVNFGFRRTVPHILGITLGHSLMVFLVGLGLAGLFRAWPVSLSLLKVVSVVYMLWLAWKIAHAGAPGEGRARPRPFSFLQAAAFQWVNPKAWAMALGAVTAYVLQPSVAVYLAVAAVFAAVNLPSVSLWAAAGQGLRRWLEAPARLRAFNWTMAALLVASLWPVVTFSLP
ncbi:MAG: LysE family translocator [Rhodobacteraceae bacterium]|jgi:threonine/homoserine/homoserine lactone efflux protein|nr:LysE family translocator [Paracoccaceae bacterium]